MLKKEQITAALQKLGPSTPATLAGELECTRGALMYHAQPMLKDGALKSAGNRLNLVLALPDQDLDGAAPPQPRQQKKKPGKRAGGKAKRKAPAARPAAPAAERFIPAMDAENRLVIVNGGEPVVFTAPQTQDIASLLLQHFKA